MADEDDLPEGETVEIDDDSKEEIVDTADGGAIVRLDEEDGPAPGTSEFYEDLSKTLSDSILGNLATTHLDLIEKDKDAREKRVKQYEDGIRRTGLGDDAPGGADFQGASKVVHPMLTEVCVDFSSRAIKELFPANGPAKSQIIGKSTKDRVAKANRKSEYMNWQLTHQCKGFRSELEQLLTQVPLGGAQYMKVTWDEPRNRPDFLFVPIDDIYLPYAASNFYAAQRKTHVQYLTRLDYEQRVKDGMYRDVDIGTPGQAPDPTAAASANDKIEGKDDSAYNEDGLRTVFEIYTFLDLEEDDPETDGPAPYILTVDKTSSKVLSLYRNWEEDDDTQEEMQWIVEFPFIPWRGAYPIGIGHMIGGLSGAATGALRALLDSAHISNSQTLVKLKGGSRGGQSLTIQPTEVLEIEGALTTDDIRKTLMPLPFNPPSTVLYQLLGFLVETGKGVVRTTMDDMGESNAHTPVGTKLAAIEQGMVVFSAIHGRLHNAMGLMLGILNRLNGMYLSDTKEAEEIGEEIASRKDFSGPMDVVPVSDPNIFSEAQRFAQMQAVAQRAQIMPQLYNGRAVEERILSTMKVPDYAELLAPASTPAEENAVSENVKASLGKPVIAFPDQDHVAHLQTHLAFLSSPAFGMSPLIAPSYLPIMLNHLKEHIVLWYADEAFAEASKAYGGELETDLGEVKDKDDKRSFDKMIAEASMNVVATADEAFSTLPPIVQQAMKMVQDMAPKGQDPVAAAAMEDIAMRKQLGEGKLAIDGQKLQLDGQKLGLEAQKLAQQEKANSEEAQRALIEADGRIEATRLSEEAESERLAFKASVDVKLDEADNAVKLRNNTDDNLVALELAKMNIEAGKKANISTNVDPGPG